MNNSATYLLSFTVFDTVDHPFFIKNVHGKFSYCNDAFAALLGKSKTSILERTWFELAPMDLANRYFEAEIQVFNRRMPVHYVASIVLANGDSADAMFNTTPLLNADSELVAYLGHVKLRATTVKEGIGTPINVLSPRENEILALISKGNSGKKIANILDLSIHTVTGHIKSIYAKLNVHSATEAIHKASNLRTEESNYQPSSTKH